ncbi:MAG: type II toxin-antitoxin system RatA family toxin [Magnetococcales bacterium]|nr:type II toxin-antitoxin system RatA family toxin [Magnetococcales bacterium]MBF0156013.1 type II toxin-antitoxin system RatA family toxin [Magnetococcales bacterium]
MPQIRLSEILPFSATQMYDLVVDVGSYPQFLPWCVKTRAFDHQPGQFMAELTVAYKGIRETFQTLDTVVPGSRVEINLKSGPFQYLASTWHFTPVGNQTRVDFFINFRFRNRVKEVMVGPVFTHISRQMLVAFRDRARAIYGDGGKGGGAS